MATNQKSNNLVQALEQKEYTLQDIMDEVFLLTGIKISMFHAASLIGKSNGIENVFFSLLSTPMGREYLDHLQSIRESAKKKS